MTPNPDPLALTGPYNVAIHTGRRSDRPRPLHLANRWCYVLCGIWHGITAANLAAALGISREALRRRLWRRDRETPGNLLRRLRIDRAKQDLAEGRTVRATAHRCGYRSVTAFSNAFKRSTGRPPGAWARKGTINGNLS